MAKLAAAPNVAVRIPGLGIPGVGCTAEANRQIVPAAIDLFGVERCMFASDFPVDSWRASFDEIYRCFAAIVGDFSEHECHALFAGSARRLYAIAG